MGPHHVHSRYLLHFPWVMKGGLEESKGRTWARALKETHPISTLQVSGLMSPPPGSPPSPLAESNPYIPTLPSLVVTVW